VRAGYRSSPNYRSLRLSVFMMVAEAAMASGSLALVA
jgi:hypothetical protein